MPDWFKHNPKLPLAITLQKGEKPTTKYPYWGSILQMIGFWHVALCQDHRSSTLGSIKSMVRRQLWKEQRCLGYRICFEIVVKLLGIYVNYWSSFRNLLHTCIYIIYMYNINIPFTYLFVCFSAFGRTFISTEWSLTIQGSKSFHVFATDAGLDSDFRCVSKLYQKTQMWWGNNMCFKHNVEMGNRD